MNHNKELLRSLWVALLIVGAEVLCWMQLGLGFRV